MKLKKVMALTMAGAMAATTLTACGSSSSTTETTKAAETTAAAAADTTAAAAADNGSSDAETVLQVAFGWTGLGESSGDHQREIRRQDGNRDLPGFPAW